MINHPVTFNRDFRHDFPPLNPGSEESLWAKCQRAALVGLPLLGLHRPFRRPLSRGMSCLRSATEASQMIDSFRQQEIQ